MTRRIAITILFTVWTMLIAGGLIAYFTTRSILLANLDTSLKTRAIALLESPRVSTAGPAMVIIGSERFIARDDKSRMGPRAMPRIWEARYLPQITSAYFSSIANGRQRTVTIRCRSISPTLIQSRRTSRDFLH